MIDHMSIQVRDVAASAAFYDTVLAPLGGRRVLDFGEVIGYGWPECHPDYYGAFVRAADGTNVEAVCNRPVAAERPPGTRA